MSLAGKLSTYFCEDSYYQYLVRSGNKLPQEGLFHLQGDWMPLYSRCTDVLRLHYPKQALML